MYRDQSFVVCTWQIGGVQSLLEPELHPSMLTGHSDASASSPVPPLYTGLEGSPFDTFPGSPWVHRLQRQTHTSVG